MKKVIKITGAVILFIFLVVVAYAAYLFGTYHRLGSGPIEASGKAKGSSNSPIRIMSWNIGFGAYEDDFDFFMDGGSGSWARSKDRLEANLDNISSVLAEQDADIYLIQEVDTDGTRTYHVNECARLVEALGTGRQYTYAQNDNRPFLLYPFTQPHGLNRSGLLTFSVFPILEAERVELPMEDTIKKILDLDRCYTKQYVSLQDSQTMVLYNLHLAAYTTDGTIAIEQLKMLLEDMQAEYEKGFPCIAGGDFNKDLLGDSSVYYGRSDKEYTWAKPIPEGTFDGFNITLVSPLYSTTGDGPVPTARNADSPYHDGQYVVNVDGFLVSDNVTVVSDNVLDTRFRYSDHNPVLLYIELK